VKQQFGTIFEPHDFEPIKHGLGQEDYAGDTELKFNIINISKGPHAQEAKPQPKSFPRQVTE
jgi:hypothetical protein